MTHRQIEARIKKVEPRLIAIATRLARGDTDLRDDLLQEARIKCIKLLETTPDCGDNLLAVASRNRMGDILRSIRQHNENRVHGSDELSIDRLLDEASAYVPEIQIDTELHAAIDELRRLKPKDAEAFETVLKFGFTDSIRRLSTNKNSLAGRLTRARTLLKQIISGTVPAPKKRGPQPKKRALIDWEKFAGKEYNQHSGPRDGNYKGDRWSRKFDCCQNCGTKNKPHMARGLCLNYYEAYTYARNAPEERAKRKAARLAASEEKTAAAYAQQKRWKKKNRKRALQSQREHYLKHRHVLNRWPVGGSVWVFYAGFWCEGIIAERVNKLRIIVRLKGGTELSVGLRSKKDIRRDRPQELAA